MNVSSNRITKVSIVLVFLIGSIIYSNTLNVPFQFDDAENITNSALRLENISADEVLTALSTGTLKNRPVSNLSFALNYYIGGYRVQGYHIVNILIHLLSGVFLFLFLQITLSLPVNKEKYGRFPVLALLVTLLWITHPLATQSVTYIVQRMNSMAAMFYIFAVLLYVKGRCRQLTPEVGQAVLPAWVWFVGSGVSTLLALGSKEIAATLPVVIFIYEWYFFQDLKWDWLRKKIYWLIGAVGIFAVLAVCYLGENPLQVVFSDCARRDFTAYERLLTQFRVVVSYISLLFYPNPDRLALDFDFPFSTSLFDPATTLYSFVGITSLFLLAVLLARRERLLSFCILWFFVNLVIESSVICLEIYFEHRTYLPSMLFLLLVIAVLYRSGIRTVLVSCALVVLIALFGYWTFQRNKIWSTPRLLWEDSITLSPGNARAHCNLASALIKEGLPEQAEKELRLSMKLDPGAEIPRDNLGALLLRQGKREEAEYYFREAVRVKPDFISARLNLGTLLRENKNYPEALTHLRAALQIEPNNAVLKKNIGNALLRGGNPVEALPYLQEALVKMPKDTEVLLDIGESFMLTGQGEQAIGVYRDVIDIDNRQVVAHYNLALLLQQTGGDVEEVLSHYRATDRLAKYPFDMLYNFGNQLFRLEKAAEAEKKYKRFLKITPTIVNTYNNLGLLLLNQGRYEEAVFCFTRAVRIDPGHQLAQNNLTLATELMEKAIPIESGGETENL